jgi:histidine phosphotransferase ChpT
MEQGPAAKTSPPPDPLDLAATLCARLCHDLAGTLGALSGAVEMAAEEQDAEALSLAVSCARELNARLRLFRAAWGTYGDTADLLALGAGLPGAERLRLELGGLPQALEPGMRRLAASLLIVAAGALPRGGAIELACSPRRLALSVAGPRVAWPSPGEGLAAREVPLALARLQASALGLRISITETTLCAETATP